uniref:Uncharacterized protein n=1 Tax=Arundo donax TaxID=35708 RepID=A0A0A8ZKD6_ARUDO
MYACVVYRYAAFDLSLSSFAPCLMVLGLYAEMEKREGDIHFASLIAT